MKQACCVASFLLALFFALGGGGCVERREKLVISPDGSVLWQVNLRSDSLDDLLRGDAVPTPGSLWIVRQGEERDDEGKVTHTLAAETAFNARRRVPDGFGSTADIQAGTCLVFPTTVTFEKRNDGTYCHFTRTYQPRPWRAIELLREAHIQQSIGHFDTDPAAWTPDQRVTITQALARFEVEKNVYFLRAAWLEALPQQPQDRFLALAAQMRGILITLDYARLSNLLVPPQDAGQEAALDQAIKLESTQLQQMIITRATEAASEFALLDGSEAAALLAAFEAQRRIQEVTEDLDDDGFEIEVQMPGTVVASNAGEVNGGVNGNTVTWKFKGESLHDRAIERIATSKIAR